MEDTDGLSWGGGKPGWFSTIPSGNILWNHRDPEGDDSQPFVHTDRFIYIIVYIFVLFRRQCDLNPRGRDTVKGHNWSLLSKWLPLTWKICAEFKISSSMLFVKIFHQNFQKFSSVLTTLHDLPWLVCSNALKPHSHTFSWAVWTGT